MREPRGESDPRRHEAVGRRGETEGEDVGEAGAVGEAPRAGLRVGCGDEDEEIDAVGEATEEDVREATGEREGPILSEGEGEREGDVEGEGVGLTLAEVLGEGLKDDD